MALKIIRSDNGTEISSAPQVRYDPAKECWVVYRGVQILAEKADENEARMIAQNS